MEEMYSKEETRSIRTGITALLVILVAVFITFRTMLPYGAEDWAEHIIFMQVSAVLTD